MQTKAVFIDINNTIVKEQKDTRDYIFEAIRSRYGLEPQFDPQEYEGVPAMPMIADILTKNGVSQEEINSRLEGCAEELGYSYYNVVGREAITVLDGSKQLLDELSKKGAILGIATGDIDKVIENKLHRANLSDYFKIGEYGNKETTYSGILSKALEKAEQNGIKSPDVWIIASYPQIIKEAKALGIHSIGVTSSRFGKEELSNAGADDVVGSVKDRGRIVKAIFR